MKKLLLLTITIVIYTTISAQDRVLLPKEKTKYAIKSTWEHPHNTDNKISKIHPYEYRSTAADPSEHVIGHTYYDLQANRSLQNRIYRYDDGCIGAVWTMGEDDPPAFPLRGTGYNFYDGTQWGPIPVTRLESIRTGWPNYAQLGEDGEIIICHDNAAFKLYILTREQKGIGDWTEEYYSYNYGPDNLACPRVITAGVNHNSIHVIAGAWVEYLGQDYAIVYSRSQDGGQTWNIENQTLDGTGIDNYQGIYVDSYVWADERAGAIAFLCGTAWYDLFLMKSTDDGDTWEKTIIWEHPYPFFDWDETITDTFFCMDNSASIALDSEGKAHVVFGINRVIHDAPGNNFWLFGYVDGIGYWNEDMEPFSNNLNALAPPGEGYVNSELIENYNYIGWMQDVDGNGSIDLNTNIMYYMELGPSTMPTITIDEQDRRFVIFSSTTEGYEYEMYNYKHLWSRAYEYGKWGPFVDLTEDIAHVYDECIYPILASGSDANIHYMYSVDGIPGLYFHNHHNSHENRIFYGSTPKADLLTYINEESGAKYQSIRLDINPNPSSGALHLRYSIPETRYSKLEIYSADGVLVKTLMQTVLQEGEHTQTFDVSELSNGIYFIRLQAGENVVTTKVILMK